MLLPIRQFERIVSESKAVQRLADVLSYDLAQAPSAISVAENAHLHC